MTVIYMVPLTEPIPDPITCAPCGLFVRRDVPWHLSASQSSGGVSQVRILQDTKASFELTDHHVAYLKTAGDRDGLYIRHASGAIYHYLNDSITQVAPSTPSYIAAGISVAWNGGAVDVFRLMTDTGQITKNGGAFSAIPFPAGTLLTNMYSNTIHLYIPAQQPDGALIFYYVNILTGSIDGSFLKTDDITSGYDVLGVTNSLVFSAWENPGEFVLRGLDNQTGAQIVEFNNPGWLNSHTIMNAWNDIFAYTLYGSWFGTIQNYSVHFINEAGLQVGVFSGQYDWEIESLAMIAMSANKFYRIFTADSNTFIKVHDMTVGRGGANVTSVSVAAGFTQIETLVNDGLDNALGIFAMSVE